jgi:hypothetical protein
MICDSSFMDRYLQSKRLSDQSFLGSIWPEQPTSVFWIVNRGISDLSIRKLASIIRWTDHGLLLLRAARKCHTSSGSMGDYNRIDKLKAAAKQIIFFVDGCRQRRDC